MPTLSLTRRGKKELRVFNAAAQQQSAIARARADFPSFLRQRAHVERIDSWMRGEQQAVSDTDFEHDERNDMSGKPFRPDEANDEHDDLMRRAPSPFAALITTSLAQTCHVQGVKMPKSEENMKVWTTWQRNGWDAAQIPLTRATIGHGQAFATALPGKDPLTGNVMTRLRAYSALQMAAFYDEPHDQWARHAIAARPRVDSDDGGWYVDLIDEVGTWHLACKGDGEEKNDWQYLSVDEHGIGVTPVVRYANRMDLEGFATGEIEPVIPLLRRIDQTTFDRLMVQRFGAWKVRYIAGMAKPTTPQAERDAEMVLRLTDLLISPDKETKFGTLDATEIAGFITAGDADLRYLSAVSQTPPHHLLGLSSNLQAEALAAAEAGLQRKSLDFRNYNGEAHEQLFRLIAYIETIPAEAQAYDMEVIWRDTESRSLNQAADALGKLATQLKIPVEMLWEQVPGWTEAKSIRAKRIIENGGIDQFLDKLLAEMDVDAEKAKAEAAAAAAPADDGDAGAAARSNDPKATPADPGGAARGGGQNSKGTPKKS